MKKMKEKIFITHKLPGNFIKKFLGDYDVEVWEGKDISREELLKKVKGVAGVVSLLTEKIDREVMEAAGEELRVIANYAVGYDNVDVGEASGRGIVVCNTPGVLTEAVAEHVMALTLALSRRIVEGDQFIRSGNYKGWEPDLLVGTGVRGKVMGIVGLGRIGRWVGRAALGMGMRVIYNSPSRDDEYELECNAGYRSLNQLLETADVVSINVPLCEETRGMIGSEQLAMMKRTAILINTARGPVVNESELIEALKTHIIAGAGLDVFENEKGVNREFFNLPNVVLTPHIASATIEARLSMAEISLEGLHKALAGRIPENIVNKEVWEKRRVSKNQSN